jgi:hypothetical protein
VNRALARTFLTCLFALAGWVAAISSAPVAVAGPSLDQFEIKNLESAPGAIEIQSQNDFSSGNPRRRVLPDGSGVIADPNTITRQREGLEIEVGLTSFVKIRLGVEFEQGRIDDPKSFSDAQRIGPLEFDGYGAESIWTLIPRKGDGIGAGFLVQWDQSAHSDEASTLTIGPIFEWQQGAWSASLNPTVIQYFGGAPEDKHKVDLGYAARVMYRSSKEYALALESYGGIERISGGNIGEAERLFGKFNQYRLGPVFYWTFGNDDDADETSKKVKGERDVETTVGTGLLLGLNKDTPATTLKFSLEVDY